MTSGNSSGAQTTNESDTIEWEWIAVAVILILVIVVIFLIVGIVWLCWRQAKAIMLNQTSNALIAQSKAANISIHPSETELIQTKTAGSGGANNNNYNETNVAVAGGDVQDVEQGLNSIQNENNVGPSNPEIIKEVKLGYMPSVSADKPTVEMQDTAGLLTRIWSNDQEQDSP